jgi:hypothetical protein
LSTLEPQENVHYAFFCKAPSKWGAYSIPNIDARKLVAV